MRARGGNAKNSRTLMPAKTLPSGCPPTAALLPPNKPAALALALRTFLVDMVSNVAGVDSRDSTGMSLINLLLRSFETVRRGGSAIREASECVRHEQ